MKISICSRKTIEKLIQNGFPENSAVISFYDPTGRYGISGKAIDYKGKTKKLFQVAVYDIDVKILKYFGLTFDTYFPEADDLAKFIYESYREGMNIICQCEYGQSRSAGCAAAIKEHFAKSGITIFRDYRYSPNQLVFNKVYDALEGMKESGA